MSVNMTPMRLIAQIEDCCTPVLEAPLLEPEAEALAGTLKVLADPARLRLVSVIAAQPGAEACVCNLTAPLGLSQPTVSHHLKLLQTFSQRFWKLYHDLLAYRDTPSPAQAVLLQAEFDQLFTEVTGYQQLDQCKARTLKKRDQLLMVL